MQPIFAVLALSFGLVFSPSASQPEPSSIGVYTATLTINTYPYAAFLETRHSDLYNLDYPWLNRSAYEASGPQPSPRDYSALVVENPWLRLTFLPELGGRLYGVTIKATGEELLYQNPVIKPTHWGPAEQPWWLAVGGIEWCLPVAEHGYEWAMPWTCAHSTTAEGVTVTLSDTTATDRLRAQIQVYLPSDRAAFQITPRLENPTTTAVTFSFWENAMLAPGAANTVGPDLRFVVPISQVTVHSRGDDDLPGPAEMMSWPVHGGSDLSRLGNWRQWLGFFARPQAAQDWVGVYDEGIRRGVARVFPHQVAVGAKGFGFGWQQAIDWHIWTDDPMGVGSAYVELHGGPSPTFWDTITLEPGEFLQWTETWLPLQQLPGLSLATPNLALGLRTEDGHLGLGVQVASQRNNLSLRLWRKADCTPLWRVDGLHLSPGEAYTHSLSDLGLTPDQVVMGVLEDDTLLAMSGSLACQAPSSQVEPLDTVQTSTAFAVQWGASDPGGLLTGYDIQVRDGEPAAPWLDLLAGTVATSATFTGKDGHTYTFRSRVHDVFGRVEEWPHSEWQDAFTTILLRPAPVLITSDKVAQPQPVYPGDVMEFQIHLRNTGNLEASVQISDPLPIYLDLTGGPTSTYPPAPEFLSDTHTIIWQGTLPAGQAEATIGFDATVLDVPPGGFINAVWIDDGVHPTLLKQVRIGHWQRFYVPVILRE